MVKANARLSAARPIMGDKVPLILPAIPRPQFRLPAPLTIKLQMRGGIPGMMCSPRELGLAETYRADDLAGRRHRGSPFAQFLNARRGGTNHRSGAHPIALIGKRDRNRARDQPLSVVNSFARTDWASSGGGTVNSAAINQLSLCESTQPVHVTWRASARFADRSSPDWCVTCWRRWACSINNVVDTLRASLNGASPACLDLHLLASGREERPLVRIRRADEGEPFTTLDGKNINSCQPDAPHADEQKPSP
jgi:hypothetical protein